MNNGFFGFPPVPGGVLAVVPLVRYLADGTSGTWTTPPLPQHFQDLWIAANLRSTVSGTSDTVAIRFNGDGGSNYDYQNLNASGGTASGSSGTAGAQGRVLFIPGGTATAGVAAAGTIYIPNYAQTWWHKTAFGQYALPTCAAAAGNVGMWGAHWRSAAAIQTVTLLLISAGTPLFAQNSTITVYGINSPASFGAPP